MSIAGLAERVMCVIGLGFLVPPARRVYRNLYPHNQRERQREREDES